jgi:prepilin-type N-terminal cleavage/methylation domain-containing protein
MVSERVRHIVGAPHGYTVTELTVVVAVLAIVAAISIPSLWTYLHTATLRAGAEEMATVLNGARQLAIQMNTTVCVTNDGVRVQYRLDRCGGETWTGAETDAAGNIQLANQVRVSGATSLCFNDLGAGSMTPPPCAANGTLTIRSPVSGMSLNVIMASTGRVRVQ